jgi:P-type Ca2+ transporter type 2C
VLNAVLGLHQEGKAAEFVAALQKMMIIKAKVQATAGWSRSPPTSSCPAS